jgi:hypothetical protein
VDAAMEEMLQMWMGCEPSSGGGVLSYVVAPEGSQTAAEGVFASWGRPTDKRRQKRSTERCEMKMDF